MWAQPTKAIVTVLSVAKADGRLAVATAATLALRMNSRRVKFEFIGRPGSRPDREGRTRRRHHAPTISSRALDLRRIGMNPRYAVRAAQQAVGLFVTGDLPLGLVPSQAPAELHRKIGEEARRRGDIA